MTTQQPLTVEQIRQLQRFGSISDAEAQRMVNEALDRQRRERQRRQIADAEGKAVEQVRVPEREEQRRQIAEAELKPPEQVRRPERREQQAPARVEEPPTPTRRRPEPAPAPSGPPVISQEVIDRIAQETGLATRTIAIILRSETLTPSQRRTFERIQGVLQEEGLTREQLLEARQRGQLSVENTTSLLAAQRRGAQPSGIRRAVPITGQVSSFILDVAPVVGTIRTWNESSNLQRGINIATDILTLVPIAGGTAAGVRAGNRVIPSITRSVVAEAVSPITAIRRPIRTAKAALEPVETAIRPSKIPLSATSIRDHTIRVPIPDLTEGVAAGQRRIAQATIQSIRGEDPVREGVRLSPVELKRAGAEPVAVHSTPDIRPFQQGAVIQEGREGGLFVSPSLHTRFTRASAFGDVPEGGVPGALIIRDVNVANRLRSSGKTFGNTIEVEAVIPPGTRLPAPSQYLITRAPDGEKLTLAVIGKPYTAAQIARLKVLGSVESVAQIFRDPIRLSRTASGKRLATAYDEVFDLRRQLNQTTEALDDARRRADLTAIRRNTDEIGSLRRQLSRANDRATALGTARFGGRVAAAYTGRQDISRALSAAGGGRPGQQRPGRPSAEPTVPPRGTAGDDDAEGPRAPRIPPARARPPDGPTRRPPPPPPPQRPPPPGEERVRPPSAGQRRRRRGRFVLPGLPRRTLPPGVFPEVVSWPQGVVRVTANLRTGVRSFAARRRPRPVVTPEEGFSIRRLGIVAPAGRRFRQGLFDVVVTPTGLRFIKRRLRDSSLRKRRM